MTKGIRVNGDYFTVMISERRIKARVKELARQINKDLQGTVPVFIGILNGSFIFFADLIRQVTIDCEVDFLKLSSYGDAKISSGNVRLLKAAGFDLIDDIAMPANNSCRVWRRSRSRGPGTGARTVSAMH